MTRPADTQGNQSVATVAVRVEPGGLSRHREDEFIHSAGRAERPVDPRDGTRRRTRLRSAKILDGAGAFLCEASIHDRSPGGIRLLLARNIGLPARFAVHDDISGDIVMAATVWRRERVLGARLFPATQAPILKPSAKAALRGRYYAVPD